MDVDQALRDVVKGAGVVYVGLLLEYLTAFLAQWLAARFLDLSDFGGIITGTAIIDIGANLGTVGLGVALARYLPRTDDESTLLEYAHTGYAIALPVSLVLGGLVAFNAEFIARSVFADPAVEPSVFVFGLGIPAATLLQLSIGGIRGRKASRYRVYVENLVRPLSRFGLVVTVTLLGFGQFAFATAYALPYLLAGVLATYLFKRTLPGFRVIGRGSRERARELLRFSTPQSFGSVAWFLVRSSDIFLLLAFLGSEAVAVYGVAYGLARLVLVFSTAFNFLGMPISSALDSDGDSEEVVRINGAILRWLVVVSVPTVFPLLVYPADILGFVYRPDYAAGGATLAVLAAGFAVSNVLRPADSMIQAAGRTDLSMANKLIAAAVNVGLNLYLIPRYGIVAAAATTVVAYVLTDALGLIELKLVVGWVPLTRRLVGPVALGVVALITGWAVASVLPVSLLVVVGLTAVVGIGYLVAFVPLVGFMPEEVMIAKDAQKRFGVTVPGLNAILDRYSRS
jgi:O-antigen/teichoic acid export membrane protein